MHDIWALSRSVQMLCTSTSETEAAEGVQLYAPYKSRGMLHICSAFLKDHKRLERVQAVLTERVLSGEGSSICMPCAEKSPAHDSLLYSRRRLSPL